MSDHERKGPQPSTADRVLERAWHAASDEQPSSSLDAAILAAAHRSVDETDASTNVVAAEFGVKKKGPARWQPLAAAAAVAGLAFILVQSLPREHDFESAGTSPATVVEPQAASPAAPALPAPADVTSPAAPALPAQADVASRRAEQPLMNARDNRAETDAVPAPAGAKMTAEANVTAAPTAPGARNEMSAAAEMPMSAVAAEKSSGTQRVMDAAAPAAQRGAVATSAASERAAQIAALYEAGDVAAAAAALREFRADTPHADSYLPESLRAWAASVE